MDENFLGLVWIRPHIYVVSVVKGGAGLELIFNSIKDAIRLKLFLSANGLQESFTESQGQFIYSFNNSFVKKDRYSAAIIQFIKEVKRNAWLNDTLLRSI